MDRQLFAFKSLVGSLIGDAKCLSSCIQLLTRQTLLKNANQTNIVEKRHRCS